MEIIGDYDIIVDDPTKHIPWAMFSSTSDALIFLKNLKTTRPKINWKHMTIEEWFEQYMPEV